MYVYLLVFPHPREQTFYLKLESSLYTNNKGSKKPILHSCTGKLCLKGVFLSQSKTGHSDRPQTSKPAFLVDSSGVLQPHGPPGNVYLVAWKVGVTCTYANESEEQPGGFAGRILKE